MKMKKLIWIVLIASLCGVILLIVSDFLVTKQTENFCFKEVHKLHGQDVALVLGTTKVLRSGNINPYYRHRMNAALELYKMDKVKYFVLSGDNGRESYNEPLQMKKDLIAGGVPNSHIYIDCAGFRTYDSVYRLKHVFQCDSAIVVSQAFHNQRALLIAQKLGMHLQALDAQDVGLSFGFKVRVREVLARFKMRLDLLFGIQPKFLGENIQIAA